MTDQPSSASLKKFSTAQLRLEMDRREQIRKRADEADRKRRSVTVVCLQCGGSGTVRNGDVMRVSSGEADEYIECQLCSGSGRCVALLIE